MVVRYDAKNARVKVTLPRYVSLKAGLEFAASREAWIAAQMEKKRGVTLENGAVIPLFGEEMQLVHVGGRGMVTCEKKVLRITGDIAFLERRTRDYIKKEMHTICRQRATFHAEKIGVKVAGITLRDTSSRWGSCSTSGDISLCWRLAFMPFAVMDYVIAHEVAHIRHHNHSAAFWQVVESLCPEFEQWEGWLKRYGDGVMG